jgi:tetrahydromethanopterin S-methyltransferase subunit B
LLNKLKEINPNAKYVFTLVYNPMKYFYFDTGTKEKQYTDGFLGPLFNMIPQMSILGNPELCDIDVIFKEYVLTEMEPYIKRINAIAEWVENYMGPKDDTFYIEKTYRPLNNIIRDHINKFGDSNFVYSDIKELFDAVPDRPYLKQEESLHYNDLVNNQLTKGYKVNDVDWQPLIEYWTTFINNTFKDYENVISSLSDLKEIAKNAVDDIVDTLIHGIVHPTIDVHPRKDGHYIMACSYLDTLGIERLPRVKYKTSNGQSVLME